MLAKSLFVSLTLIGTAAFSADLNLNVLTSVKVYGQKSAAKVLQDMIAVGYGGEDLPELRATLELKTDAKSRIVHGKLVSFGKVQESDKIALSFKCEAVIVSNAKAEMTFSKRVQKELGETKNKSTEVIMDANCDTLGAKSEKVFFHLIKNTNDYFGGVIQVGEENEKTARYYKLFGDIQSN